VIDPPFSHALYSGCFIRWLSGHLYISRLEIVGGLECCWSLGQSRWMQRECSELILPCARSECIHWPHSRYSAPRDVLVASGGIVVFEATLILLAPGMFVECAGDLGKGRWRSKTGAESSVTGYHTIFQWRHGWTAMSRQRFDRVQYCRNARRKSQMVVVQFML